MADAFDQTEPTAPGSAINRWNWVFAKATKASPALLFGVRLWAAVCLALFVAFWLELDNPFWAGASAAVVCQPHLGASLRKGWFRMVGTAIGAIAITALTGAGRPDSSRKAVELYSFCQVSITSGSRTRTDSPLDQPPRTNVHAPQACAKNRSFAFSVHT